jgi:hypothetical protein
MMLTIIDFCLLHFSYFKVMLKKCQSIVINIILNITNIKQSYFGSIWVYKPGWCYTKMECMKEATFDFFKANLI